MLGRRRQIMKMSIDADLGFATCRTDPVERAEIRKLPAATLVDGVSRLRSQEFADPRPECTRKAERAIEQSDDRGFILIDVTAIDERRRSGRSEKLDVVRIVRVRVR